MPDSQKVEAAANAIADAFAAEQIVDDAGDFLEAFARRLDALPTNGREHEAARDLVASILWRAGEVLVEREEQSAKEASE